MQRPDIAGPFKHVKDPLNRLFWDPVQVVSGCHQETPVGGSRWVSVKKLEIDIP